jgi:hypothetical protein
VLADFEDAGRGRGPAAPPLARAWAWSPAMERQSQRRGAETASQRFIYRFLLAAWDI